MLVAERITVRCEHKFLLNDVSLTLHPGELLAVLGPNGAGKSTLLKTLAGDLMPTSGRAILNGKPMTAWPVRTRALMRAVLPQDVSLRFAFRAHEVVLMGRMPHVRGVERAEDYRIAQAALAAVEAAHLRERLFPTLSGGERQRVQLARVLAQIWEPCTLGARFLLLDEPTAALDLAHQHLTLQLARRLAAQGVGVLAILHDLNVAAQYADRIALLANGRLLDTGAPAAVLSAENLWKAFGVRVSVIQHPVYGTPLVIHDDGSHREPPLTNELASEGAHP